MLKLYKQIDNQLHYWETWDTDQKAAMVHWGVVGTRGQEKEVKSGLFSSFAKKVKNETAIKLKEGYAEIEDEDMAFLEIHYKIADDNANHEELDKRHRLEDFLDEVLGWTGLGSVDGGGFMDACCLVVDFDIAKKVIEEELKNTEFSDYTEILRTDEEG